MLDDMTNPTNKEAGDFPASPIAAALPLVCNVADEVLYANIRQTVERGHPIITVVPPHDRIALLIGGGPSAKDDLDDIFARQKAGAAIFALNGAGLWLQSHGITPHALIILDARPHNVRFVKHIHPSVVLYLASQCDPLVFAAGNGNPIIAWHPPMGGQSGVVEHRDTVLIGGSTTVGLRALRLVHVLGFRTAHLYGYDSSYRNTDAHAYAQPENADDVLRSCTVEGKSFVSTAWMIRQADDFRLIAAGLIAEGMHIHVHGDGLLPTVAAAMNIEEKPAVDPTALVHPLAFVEDATVGPRTRIWQFASVIRGTVLGEDCTVASGATLDGPRFGDRCIISQGVAMGPGFLFGNDIFVGPNVTICNDRWPTVDKSGFDLESLRRGQWAVIVKDGASIGANAVILPGVVIGARAMVAAGAVVTCNIPDDHMWTRNGRIVPIERREPSWRMRRATG